MASVNKVILVGNLGRDPDVRYNPDGFTVANISLATTFSWKDRNTGDRREETEWHRVVFFNRQAEVVGQYLKKGSQVYIEGRLRTRKYTDKDGVERYTTEVVAETMQMLGGRNSGGDVGMGDTPDYGGVQAAARGGNSYDDYGFSSTSQAPTNTSQNTNTGFSSERPAAPKAPAASDMIDLKDDIPF